MDYEEFFGLKDTPFRLTPDIKFYYPSEDHEFAVESIMAAIKSGKGFVRLIGESGTGKTTILKIVQQKLDQSGSASLIVNPKISAGELIRIILKDMSFPVEKLGSDEDANLNVLIDVLRERIKNGQHNVIMMDDAHRLSNETWDGILQLAAGQVSESGLFTLILSGENDLEKRLLDPELVDMADRVSTSLQLKNLSRPDSDSYLNWRGFAAGGPETGLFTPQFLEVIHATSRGNPFQLNVLAERAMIAAYVEGDKTLAGQHLEKAVDTMDEKPQPVLKEKNPDKRKASLSINKNVFGYILSALIAVVVYHFIFQSFFAQPRLTTDPVAGIEDGARYEDVLQGKANLPAGYSFRSKLEPETGPSVPTLPSRTIQLPAGNYFLSADQINKTAFLWLGDSPSPMLKAELKWSSPPDKGLYLLGASGSGRKYMFKFPPAKQPIPASASDIWLDLAELVPGKIIPIMVLSDKTPARPSGLEKAGEIKNTVMKWADAWRKKDLEAFTALFADQFSSYPGMEKKPTIYDKKKFHEVKKYVFKRSGDISLDISEPVCLLDPEDDSRGLAFFKQVYKSDVYSDEGFQVLYFKLFKDENGKEEWKITAKVWAPK